MIVIESYVNDGLLSVTAIRDLIFSKEDPKKHRLNE